MDPIDKANKLIQKGKQTNNRQLIQLGEEMLAKYAKTVKPEQQFTMRRNPEAQRAVYDEAGNKIGVKQRKEPIQVDKNRFTDNRKEAQDKANEMLKKFTIRTPRERQAATTVVATCASCGKQDQVNPIHTKISSYRCVECVKRMKH